MKKIMIFALIMISSMNLNASQNNYARRKWALNQLLDMNGFDEDEFPRFEIPYQLACPERLSSPVIGLKNHDDYYMPTLSKSELISLISSGSHEKAPTMVVFMDYNTEFDNRGNMKNISYFSMHCHIPQASTEKYQEPVYELTDLGKYLVSKISMDALISNNDMTQEKID